MMATVWRWISCVLLSYAFLTTMISMIAFCGDGLVGLENGQLATLIPNLTDDEFITQILYCTVPQQAHVFYY